MHPPGADLSLTTRNRVPDKYDLEDTDTSAYVYAIPTTDLYGLMLEFAFDNRESIMLIPAYSQNQDNAAKMIQWLYDRYYYAEEPDFVESYDEYVQYFEQQNQSLMDMLE